MGEGKLYLIGVIHRDEKAKGRLREILRKIDPHIITVEFTHYGLNFRRRNYSRIRSKIKKMLPESRTYRETEALKDIVDFFRIPYEYRVASNYAKKRGIPLYLVDMDFFSFFRLRHAYDLLRDVKVFMSSEGENPNRIELEKRVASIYFEKNTRLFDYSPDMRVRDEYAFRLIKRIMEENMGKKIVHICGWQHLADESGYFSLLQPHKIYIYDKALRF